MNDQSHWPQSRRANIANAFYGMGDIPMSQDSSDDIDAIANLMDESEPVQSQQSGSTIEDKCNNMLSKMPDLYQPKPIIDGHKEESKSPTSIGGRPIVNKETEMKKYLDAGYEIIKRI